MPAMRPDYGVSYRLGARQLLGVGISWRQSSPRLPPRLTAATGIDLASPGQRAQVAAIAKPLGTYDIQQFTPHWSTL